MNTPYLFTLRSSFFTIAAVMMLSTPFARANVKMPAIFGNHMVLQQEAALPIWGMADPDEAITVTLGTETATTTTGTDGTWMLKLPPVSNGTAPMTLTVKGKNTLVFSDVLVGDVWLCGGQSNMELNLSEAHNAAEIIPKANDEQLRLFTVDHRKSVFPKNDLEGEGKWKICTPDVAKRFSAVGYFFGSELRNTLNRPIGLISSNSGGTPAQAWSSISSLRAAPVLQHYIDAYDALAAVYPQAIANYPAQMAAYKEEREKYEKGPGGDYFKKIQEYNLAVQQHQQPLPPKPEPTVPLPIPPKDPEGEWNSPTVLFNAMIHPLIPYAIKGAIWYQGEANVKNAAEYETLFTSLISGWRGAWKQGDFPFLFAQLESTNGSSGENWPLLRESQAKALKLPNTAMIVTADIGIPKDVHPKDKLDVGKRFALAARHIAYGQDLVFSGPSYDSLKIEGGTIRLSFTNIGGGLVIGAAPWVGPGVTPLPTNTLAGFFIAAADMKWVPADAKIEGSTVSVSSPQVSQPIAVRYGWQNFIRANLYNKEGIPSAPFRTDTQPYPACTPLPNAPASPVN